MRPMPGLFIFGRLLRGSPVRMLFKNFLANHQLDVDCCTG
jgi:hypothetical protein